MLNSVTLAGVPISEFQIVYPAHGNCAEIYAAIVLQHHFHQHLGLILPTHDDSHPEAASEILIGHTNRLSPVAEDGAFSISMNRGKLQVTADGFFGYQEVAAYLPKLFGEDVALDADFSYRSEIHLPNVMATRNGDLRVMFHNVWYHYISGKSFRFGVHNGRYELSLIMGYHPDVFGFNEFFSDWRRKSDMIALLRENGYLEAQPEGDTREMYNPLFYDPAKLKLLHCRLINYGDLIVGDDKKAIIPSERYYTDDSEYCWHTGVVGVFEILETKRRLAVCNTHLESNTFVPHQTPEEGDPLRAEQVGRVLIPTIKEIAETFDVPVLVGGDYNSVVDRIACRLLREAGFDNTRDLADVKNTTCSCHSYPVYSDELDAYVGGTHSCNGYELSIDQIFALDPQKRLEVKVYHTLDDDIVGYISDHCPVLLDFTIKK